MFLTELFEATGNRHASFCFGRMNPPTVGHGQLVDTVAKSAQGGDYFIFVSQTQDKKKNPLDYATKIKFIKALFPNQASHVVSNPELKTIMQVAEWLYNAGYRAVTFVAGSDRMDAFSKLLNDYNGVEGKLCYYKFDEINFVSSGDRDPDSDGIAGVSASSAREAAVAGDLDAFAQATGAGKLAQSLYDAVRNGMLLSESADKAEQLKQEIEQLKRLIGNPRGRGVASMRKHLDDLYKELAQLKNVDEGWKDAAIGAAMIGAASGVVAWDRSLPHVEVDGNRWHLTQKSPGGLAHPRIAYGADGKKYQVWRGLKGRRWAQPVENEQVKEEIESGKVYDLLGSLYRYLSKAMPGVVIDGEGVGIRVYTRGDGTRYREPANLRFKTNSERDQAFDILTKALTGAKATQVTGEFGSSEAQPALIWKGKVIAKYGPLNISLGAASRVTNKNSVWRERPVSECSGYIPKNKKEAKDPRWSNALTVDVHPDTPTKNAKALRLA